MKLNIREITYTALFVSFAIVCAMLIRFGSGIVPFSLLPFIAVLAGAILGKRLGAYALGVYVFMGLIGIPVLAKPPFGEFTYIFQPTFGFLIGFIAGAFMTGWILEKGRSAAHYILASITGMVVIYLIGLPYIWLILNLYLGKAADFLFVLEIGFFPFILLDLAKAVFAALIAKKVVSRLSSSIGGPWGQVDVKE